ncbi:MAG: hypothetical protein EAZ95_14255 [Bacteroidetes bacterium]|nr:MAG: hypothetical protein EAZ95_14255 [Bacteroidota bacterium]
MKKIYIVALFFIATLALASCGGKKGSGMSAAHVKIPKDASAVVGLDLKQLQAKSYSVKDLLKGNLAKELTKDKRAMALLTQAIDAIDTDQKAYMFLKEAEKGSYYAVSFVLKDAEKFKKLFKDELKVIEFKKEGDVQLAMLSPLAPIAIGYKGKTALIMGNQAISSLVPKQRSYDFDDIEEEEEGKSGSLDDAEEEEESPRAKRDRLRKKMEARKKKEQASQAQPMSDDEFKKTFLQVFNTSAAESLQEPAFIASESAGYDVSVWYDINALQKLQKAGMDAEIDRMTESYPLLKELMNMKGTAYAGIKFEKGEAIMEVASHMDKDMAKKYGKLMKTGGEKLARTVPIDKPTGFFSMSLDMNNIFNLLKDDKNAMEGMEMSAKEVEMKPKDLFDTFDGNFVVAVGNFDVNKVMRGSVGSLELVVGVGVNKKENMKKLLKKAISEKTLIDKGNGVYQMKSYSDDEDAQAGFVVEKNNAIYVTPAVKTKDALASGKGGLDASKISGNVYTMYLDLQRVFNNMPEVSKDKEAKVFVEKLKDVTMTMTPFKNDIATGKMVVRFNDSKNALLIISDMVQKATEMQNRRDLSMR